MSLIQNHKIASAAKAYTITDTVDFAYASFTDEFEEKMERFIKRKQRSRKIYLVSQRFALAVLTVALAGSWLYLMTLPRNGDGIHSSSVSQQDGSSPGQELPQDAPHNTPGDETTVPVPPPDPTGLLVIRNDEVNMGVDSRLRQGIISWDEARSLTSFDLQEATVLPEGAELSFIEFSQTGENGSYPCAAALYTVPFHDRTGQHAGMWHLYYFQYYIGTSGRIELLEESEWLLGFTGRKSLIFVKAEPAEVVSISEVDVMLYTFSINSSNTFDLVDLTSEFLALHWVQNDVLFRIVAPTGFYGDNIVSLSREELLVMAESIIKDKN